MQKQGTLDRTAWADQLALLVKPSVQSFVHSSEQQAPLQQEQGWAARGEEDLVDGECLGEMRWMLLMMMKEEEEEK